MRFLLFYFLLINCLLFLNCKKDKPKTIIQEKALNKLDSIHLEVLKMFQHNEVTELKFDTSYFPNFKSNYQPTGERTNIDSMTMQIYDRLFWGRGNKYFPEGTASDSLKLIPFFDEFRFLEKTGYSKEKFNQQLNLDLIVFVDTTQFVKGTLKYYPKIKTGDEYPVYLINQSNKWYFRWFDLMSFTLIMEAYHKENQQWQPIEYQTTHSGFYIIMAPESYIVTSALIYEGNYSTKMRLKYKQASGMTYSNEFYGSINKTQFDTISKQKEDLLSVYHF